MKALIFVVHGSKNRESNKEVKIFFDGISTILGNSFTEKQIAFLQFGEPSFENSMEELCLKNPKSITIFPYFLMNGAHVKKDIPEIVQYFSDKFKNIEFKLLPALIDINGMDRFISDFIMGKKD